MNPPRISTPPRATRLRGFTVLGGIVVIAAVASGATLVNPKAFPPPPAKVSFPIHADAKFDPVTRRAHVSVTSSQPGTDIVVKVYGLDGLVVVGGTQEGTLLVRTEHRATLKPGESMEFDVTVQPGDGQSYLVVSAQGKGIGQDMANVCIGELSEAQKRERQRGTTVDPEGHPVKILNP